MELFSGYPRQEIMRSKVATATEAQISAILRPRVKRMVDILKKSDDHDWVLTVFAVAAQEHPHNINLALKLTDEVISEFPLRQDVDKLPDVQGKISAELGSGGCPSDQYWVPNPKIKKTPPGVRPGGYCKHPPGHSADDKDTITTYDSPGKDKIDKQPEDDIVEPEPGDIELEDEEPEDEKPEAPVTPDKKEVEPFKATPIESLSDDGKKERLKFIKYAEYIYNAVNTPAAFAEIMLEEAGIDPKKAKVLKFVLSASDFGLSSLGTAIGQYWMVPIPCGSLIIGTIAAMANDKTAPVKAAKRVVKNAWTRYKMLKDTKMKKQPEKEKVSVNLLRICSLERDILPGGKSDNLSDKNFNPESLARGIQEEHSEHGGPLQLAKEIAEDHLSENPDEYDMTSGKCSVDLFRVIRMANKK